MMRHAPLPLPAPGKRAMSAVADGGSSRHSTYKAPTAGTHAAGPADLRSTADDRPRHGHDNRPAKAGRAQRSLSNESQINQA
jgi:hypothetical protein